MHSYLTWQAQSNSSNTRYGLFVAEVASNFNQALVRAHLLNSNDDPEFQIAVIEEAMANFHRYFFIMPTLARFELEIHERVERGQALNADSMIALLTELFAEGYGREVELDHDRFAGTGHPGRKARRIRQLLELPQGGRLRLPPRSPANRRGRHDPARASRNNLWRAGFLRGPVGGVD